MAKYIARNVKKNYMTPIKKETTSGEVVSKESNNSIALTTGKRNYSREEIELIKTTMAVGATDNELKLFLTICRNKRLDPFSNQIHFIKRKVWSGSKQAYDEKATIQTGIDGYRAIAERTGDYMGNDDPIFLNEPTDPTHPFKATVTVWKMVKGVKCAFTASALWQEYAPKEEKQAFLWRKMPFLMLGKVAEALALRKAFPNDLSGIYTNEEMSQAEPNIVVTKPDGQVQGPKETKVVQDEAVDINELVPGNPPVGETVAKPKPPIQASAAKPISKAQLGYLHALVKQKGVNIPDEELINYNSKEASDKIADLLKLPDASEEQIPTIQIEERDMLQ